jgi:hypothetical protein
MQSKQWSRPPSDSSETYTENHSRRPTRYSQGKDAIKEKINGEFYVDGMSV